MHYSYEATVTPSHTVAVPLLTSMKLASGILKNIEIAFPAGCCRCVRCCIYDRGKQIFPNNAQGYYAEDNEVVRFPCYYDLDQADNQLYLIAWSIGASYDHIISCRLYVRDPNEPDITTFIPQLMSVMGRMVDWLRAVY